MKINIGKFNVNIMTDKGEIMAKLNETPSANRLHIGFFGNTNSGKSSIINAFTGQNVSIVAEVHGTTTDLVHRSMEIAPLGPCTIIDTAGFNDKGELGKQRIEKTKLAGDKTDIAVIVISVEEYGDCLEEFDFEKCCPMEYDWYEMFVNKNTPVLFLINKQDLNSDFAEIIRQNIISKTKFNAICVSASTDYGILKIKEELSRLIPENHGEAHITGELVQAGDLVMLVMPQDIQAPKGRLILPQVQTTRELLDRKCKIISVTPDQMVSMLELLNEAPKLIITDSQVFEFVYKNKPKESMLTSFSVLFAAYKGDFEYYMQGAKVIDSLNKSSKVLIAECCTHAPLAEDIGRVKIPAMLKKRFGEELEISVVSGTDFPNDLSEYDLIIQCGGCMFNRKYILSRIDRARGQNVPMTNYGVTIAHITGILDKISY